MTEVVAHPTLVWQCVKCKTETPVNMAHPRVAAGEWKPGAKIAGAMCRKCGRGTPHKIVCHCPQCEPAF